MSRQRTSVLLIRVWLEEEPPTLRARIIQRSDAAGPDQTLTIATTVEDVNAAVTWWLRTFLADQVS